MVRVNILLTSLFAVINICRGLEPVQICHADPTLHTDACMAVTTIKSQHERGNDLLMTFSIRFYQGNGWVAFGVGDIMDRALMFVLWPGEQENSELLHPKTPLKRYTNIAKTLSCHCAQPPGIYHQIHSRTRGRSTFTARQLMRMDSMSCKPLVIHARRSGLVD
jgi:hypothetical protein